MGSAVRPEPQQGVDPLIAEFDSLKKAKAPAAPDTGADPLIAEYDSIRAAQRPPATPIVGTPHDEDDVAPQDQAELERNAPRLRRAASGVPAAPIDATRTGAAPETGTNLDILVKHLRGELQPAPAPPTSLAGRTLYAAGSMAAHPAETAAMVATAPFQAAYTLGQFSRQELEKAAAPAAPPAADIVTPGKDVVSKREAAFAAGQLLVPGAASKALPYLETVFGAKMAQAAVDAVNEGKNPGQALLTGWAARTGLHAAAGAATGAVYSKDDPAMGALLGAALGGAHAASQAPSVRIPVRDEPTGPVADVSTQIGKGPKGPLQGTATILRTPPATPGPDYTVESPAGNSAAPMPAAEPDYLKDWDERQMGPKPTREEHELWKKRVIDSFLDVRARDLAASPREVTPPEAAAPAAPPAPAPKSPMNSPEEIAARDVAPGSTPPEPGPRKFPATASAIADLATQRGITADEAGSRLAAAGYDVPEAALAQARASIAPPSTATPAADPLITEYEAKKEPTHEFSSTQLNLPAEHADAIKAMAAKIPDTDLAEDGREDHPHVTVKFGLHTNDVEDVRSLLADQPPITVKLGKTSMFPAKESGNADVLKVDVNSPELHALNKKIADALPNTDTHPDYQPHATVAYLKPGTGKKYVGDTSMEGRTMTIDHLTFSDKNRQTVDIPLGGATTNGKRAPGSVITDAMVKRAAEPATPPEEADFIRQDAAIEDRASAADLGQAGTAKDYVDKALDAGWRVKRKGAKVSLERGLEQRPLTNPAAADYALVAQRRRADAISQTEEPEPEPSKPEPKTLKNPAPAEQTTEPAPATEAEAPKRNRFADLYEQELRAEVTKNPQDFKYGVDEVPRIVDKMTKSIAEKNANIRGSKALQRVARQLGIKFNMSEMAKAAAEAPATAKQLEAPAKKPVTPQVPPPYAYGLPKFVGAPHAQPEIKRAIAGASEDLNAPHESGLTLARETAIRQEFTPASFSDAELGQMEQELRAKAAAHGDRNEEQQANEASFRADLTEQEIKRRSTEPKKPAPKQLAKPGATAKIIEPDLNPKNRYVPNGVDLEDAANSPSITDVDTPLVKAARIYTAEQGATIDRPNRGTIQTDAADAEFATLAPFRGRGEIGMVIGLPGSGKTSIAAQPLAAHLSAGISDVDNVKSRLPEYERGWGSEVVYQEAGKITKGVRARLQAEHVSYVHPGLGANTDAILKELDALHEKGYQVHLVRVSVSPAKARERAVSRFEDGGHFVRPEYVDYVGTKDAETYDRAKTHPAVASYALIDNDGDTPVIVEQHGAGWLAGSGLDEATGRRGRGQPAVASVAAPAEGAEGVAHAETPAATDRSAPAGDTGAVGAALPVEPQEERSGSVRGPAADGRARESGRVNGPGGGEPVSEHAERADETGAPAGEVRPAASAGRSTPEAGGGDRVGERAGADTGVEESAGAGVHGPEHGDVGPRPAATEALERVHAQRTPEPHGLNYRLSDADDIGAGSRVTKVKQNLAAIRLLKALRDGERVEATPAEQATLAKYVGWGAFPGYFDPNHKDYGRPEAKELRDALTPAEYEEARSSTQNAHYTSPDVVKAMWRIMTRFGLSEGRVLEPSMGVGNFIGFAPEHMKLGWVGVEKDPLTGHIAKYLYPESQIYVSGYEDVPLRNGMFDVAIGNVPFGRITVYDPKYKHLKGFSIHDYFFAKTIDKVRPGGIVAFITSRHTMDKGGQAVRRYIADRADLLGALRLPNTAFKGNAGTEVVTDLILLRVREKNAAPAGEPWLGREFVPVGKNDGAEINEYYAKHPDMMLGNLGFTRGQFSDHDLVLLPHKGADLATLIDDAKNRNLPADALLPDSRPVAGAQQLAIAEAPVNSRPGTYLVHEGKVAQVGLDGQLIDAQVPKAQDAKVRKLIDLRDQARELVKLNTTADASDAAIEKARKALEKSYRAFVKQFGPINLEKRSTGVNKNGVAWTRTSYPNRDIVDDDPDLSQLLALEHYDSATDKATPADLITKGRIIPPAKEVTSADTGFDAVVASLGKFGRLDLDYMAQLRGVSPDALKKELEGDIFEDPGSGDWEIKAKYLSGNVRDKLVAAKAAAKIDPRFRANVDALRAVAPPDLPASAINVRFGARWVKPAEYAGFIADLLGGSPDDVTVTQDDHTGLWEIQPGRLASSVKNTRELGTEKMSATDIIQATMNSKSLRIRDTIKTEAGTRSIPNPQATAIALARQKELTGKFRDWLFTADKTRGDQMARRYNDEYNNIVPPTYDGSLLTVPGTATHIAGKDFTWFEHQKNAVMRYLQNGNILLAHAPGAGKTYTFIAMAMEARRFGLAKRPMIAVPNHMLAQATREAQQLYPGARILALNTDDTSSKAKALLAARAASNEWDLIITTHNGMGRIPMSKAAQVEFLREQINELREALTSETGTRRNSPNGGRGKPKSVKRIEATLEDYEARMKEMMDAPTDTSMTFEELGVDLLAVDEAHLFKNLNFATRVEGIQVGDTKAATWLHMKTQYLHRINPTHGIIFATGTPVTNSIAELWTMERYVNPRGLKERGLERFDDWQAIFATIVSRMEKNTVGNYEVKSRLAKYVNVPAMIQMFREFADVKTIAELNLPRPPLIGGAFKPVVAPEPPEMKAFLSDLRDKWEALKKMTPEEQIESGMSFLSLGNQAKNAGLDMRLVDAGASDDATYKVDLAAREILDRYQAHAAHRGAQVVFLDASVDKGEHAVNRMGGRHGFSVYAELKRKLIAGGIPAKEIAFSQEATSEAKKKVMFRKVNDGEIRVIVGSTSQMGVGTNMQRRLVALHRLDVPWRPDQIEQSEARILRMGNELYNTGKIPGVEILRYVTEGSYDQYSWDTVLRKARFIAQAMSGDASIAELDEMADESSQGAQLMAAMASNNPLELERADLSQQVAELQAAAQGHRNEQGRISTDLHYAKRRVTSLEADEKKVAQDAAQKTDTKGDKFAIRLTIGGKPATYTERPAAGDALLKALSEIPKGSVRAIGEFAGFTLEAKAVGESYLVSLGARIADQPFIQGNQTANGALMQIEAGMRKVGNTEPYPKWIAETKQQIAELSQLTGRGFQRAGDLEKAQNRLKEVEAELMAQSAAAENKGEPPVAPPDTEDYGGGADAMAIADPFTAMYQMYKQAQALRRRRMGLPPAAETSVLDPAINRLTGSATELRDIFNPAAALPEAGQASRIIRAGRGEMDMDLARARQSIEDVRDALDSLSPGKNFDGPRWDWYRDMEAGRLDQIHGPLQGVAHVFRKLLDDTRDEIQALGPGHLDSVIENYMPRIYGEGPKIKSAAHERGTRMGKRPFQPKNFKKQRAFETLDDAIAAGYKPISDNPIDMLLLKLREMRKYLMAQRIKEEMKATGLVKFTKGLPPDGWSTINDNAFTVFAPRDAEGAQRIRGRYIAPVEVARIVNNFLSPGLRGRSDLYDSYNWLGNMLNLVQLGMSAFHAGFVAFDATVQTASVGLDQLMTGAGKGGRLAGAGKLLIAGASAATGPISVIPLPAAVLSYLRGSKVWHAYFNDTSSVEMQRMLKALTEGGGRARMDDYYRAGNVEKFRSALRDHRWASTILHAPFAAIEGSMYPLLEHVVPRMKLGAIEMMMEVELSKLPPGATDDQVRKVAAKVVDAVDARLGQMIYDNRFWHRATKEIMMAGIRSVGWDVGTFDVTLGGAAQAAGNVRRLIAPGAKATEPRWVGPAGGATGHWEYPATEPPEWHKVQYLAALAGVVALYGAIYTYLHTGDSPRGKDFYFPRTGKLDRDGNPERIQPATYVKDIFSIARHPVDAVLHKIHPLLQETAEALQNRDFYGNQIRNPDDPGVVQLRQIVDHIIQSATPLSIRNASELTKRGITDPFAEEKVQGFFGNQAAPREVVKTTAQNKMNEILARRGQPVRTPEEQTARQGRQDILGDVRSGDVKRDSLRRLVRAGELTPGQAQNMASASRENALVTRFKMLTPEEARTVYDLGTPEEQDLWDKVLKSKERRNRLRRPMAVPPA